MDSGVYGRRFFFLEEEGLEEGLEDGVSLSARLSHAQVVSISRFSSCQGTDRTVPANTTTAFLSHLFLESWGMLFFAILKAIPCPVSC